MIPCSLFMSFVANVVFCILLDPVILSLLPPFRIISNKIAWDICTIGGSNFSLFKTKPTISIHPYEQNPNFLSFWHIGSRVPSSQLFSFQSRISPHSFKGNPIENPTSIHYPPSLFLAYQFKTTTFLPSSSSALTFLSSRSSTLFLLLSPWPNRLLPLNWKARMGGEWLNKSENKNGWRLGDIILKGVPYFWLTPDGRPKNEQCLQNGGNC